MFKKRLTKTVIIFVLMITLISSAIIVSADELSGEQPAQQSESESYTGDQGTANILDDDEQTASEGSESIEDQNAAYETEETYETEEAEGTETDLQEEILISEGETGTAITERSEENALNLNIGNDLPVNIESSAAEETEALEEETTTQTEVSKKLTAPVIKSVRNSTKGINIQWSAALNAVSYQVYRKQSKGRWVKVADTAGSYYYDKTAAEGKSYTYKVRAVSENGKTKTSQGSGSIIFIKPVNMASAVNQAKDISLSWKKSKYAAGYKLYRRAAGGTWAALKTTGRNYYTDSTGLKTGMVYEYAVKTYITVKGRKYYSCLDESRLIKITRLKAPVLKAAESSSNSIKVTWNAEKGAAKYTVYTTTSGKKWKKVGTTKDSFIVDKDVSLGISKSYKIISSDRYGNKSVESRKRVSAVYVPETKVLTASNKVNSINITWKKVKGIKGYKIYRKLKGGKWEKLAAVKKGITSYADKSAKVSGSTYIYAVKPYIVIAKKKYYSSISTSKTFSKTWLHAPAITSIATEDESFKITWESVPGADYFNLYKRTGEGSWSLLASTTGTSFIDSDVIYATTYSYKVQALKTNGVKSKMRKPSAAIFYLYTDPAYYTLPSSRYLDLGWDVSPYDSWGPNDYGQATKHGNKKLMTKPKWWTYHVTYNGDAYTPKAGDIIRYGTDEGTQEHVDICVSDYDPATNTFGVVTGNWGSHYSTSDIAYAVKNWSAYTSSGSYGSNRIYNIWECKLPEAKKKALVNTAWGMYSAYQNSPDVMRGMILACKPYNNWCDVFVSYVIYVAR